MRKLINTRCDDRHDYYILDDGYGTEEIHERIDMCPSQARTNGYLVETRKSGTQ